jgi:hypothetical protein
MSKKRERTFESSPAEGRIGASADDVKQILDLIGRREPA